jgi:hypothetical protein
MRQPEHAYSSTIAKAASVKQMLHTYVRQPARVSLLKNAYNTIKPVLSQFRRSFYICMYPFCPVHELLLLCASARCFICSVTYSHDMRSHLQSTLPSRTHLPHIWKLLVPPPPPQRRSRSCRTPKVPQAHTEGGRRRDGLISGPWRSTTRGI